MNKSILLTAVMFLALHDVVLSQNTMINIEQEAFKEYRRMGGSVEQWNDYKSDAIEHYRAKYLSGSKGQSTENARMIMERANQQMQMSRRGENHRYNPNSPKYNPRYIKGTMTFSNGQGASFRHGQVSNQAGQVVGYFNNSAFVDSYNRCVGIVRGNDILTCNGGLIARVQNGYVYSSQGQVLYAINGDVLSNNYMSIAISGIDMGSLAAFLLFFH